MNKKFFGTGIFLLVVGVATLFCSFITVPLATDEPFQMPTGAYLIAESFSVPPAGYLSHNKTLSSGDFLHIYVKVTSGGDLNIDFYVMDELNYYKWKGDESASPQISRTKITTYDSDWVVPYNGTWYFVCDNSFSSTTSKEVATDITKHWTETFYRQVTRDRPLVPQYLGFSVLLGGVVALIVGEMVEETPRL